MNDSCKTTTPSSSLRLRIIVSALIIVLVVVPSIGIALNNAFKAQIEENIKAQLNAYFYAVLAVTEFENDELIMPEALLENQFNVINSGLYTLITKTSSDSSITYKKDELLWFSNSFLGSTLNESLPTVPLGEGQFAQIMLDNKQHFVYSFSVRFESISNLNPSPVITLHIVKDRANINQQLDTFSQQLWTWMAVLMVVLFIIQLFWLVWTLKPLAKFTQELSDIQNARTKQLSQQYPKELASVASQLNNLLSNEQKQRKRYRNALSDLAHSLKTPLAVIQSQQDLSSTSQEQVSQINKTIHHQLTRAQSSGNNAWHLGIEILPVVTKLTRTLNKIYPHIDIKLNLPTTGKPIFKGDESDLMEMLGNVFDNACKSAAKQVLISLTQLSTHTHISVEDDGQGISPALKSQILQRGKRADTYTKGHGIGLAIVQDLLDSYGGSLELGVSEQLKGAKFILSIS